MSALPASVDDFIRDMPTPDIPSATLNQAGLLLLDTLGVAIAATPMEEAGVLARETAYRLFGANRPEDSAWMMLHDGSGMGALVGLSALVMAEMGFTGAPAITVEAEAAQTFWADLAQVWQTDLQYIKPYPIYRWAHAPIDEARKLALEHGVTHDQIARIDIRSFANAIALFHVMPQTTSQAQYSLAFAVGCMIRHGTIGLAEISGAGLRDKDVAALIAKTHLSIEPRHEARFPDGRWADINITLKGGRVFDSGDMNAPGGPQEPFSAKQICEKFLRFAVPVVGETRAQAIKTACLPLNQDGSQFAPLLALLKDPSPSADAT